MSGNPSRRSRAQRRADRKAGVDRFGNPLPRVAGTNPRAMGTNPRALRAALPQRTYQGETASVAEADQLPAPPFLIDGAGEILVPVDGC